MNKTFLLAALSALLASSQAAPVVQVTATPVTVTAGSYGYASQHHSAKHSKRAAKASAASSAAAAYSATATPSSGASAPSVASSAPSTASSVPSTASSVPSTASSGSSAPTTSSPASSSSSSGSSSSSSSSGSGSLGITQDQFMAAWTNGKQYLPDPNIPAPTTDQYNAFINNASSKGGIASKTELAMFLAEIMWESGGLYYKSELACQQNNCAGSYQDSVGIPGKYYYGRGYIQLTWGANYKAASNALYNNDDLLNNPDQVATNEDYAWGVSFWYWKANVKPALNNTYDFGLATKAINGALECSGSGTDIAKKRYQIYTEVLKVFEPSATPIESGCYN